MYGRKMLAFMIFLQWSGLFPSLGFGNEFTKFVHKLIWVAYAIAMENDV
jgi:hypothetical protein